MQQTLQARDLDSTWLASFEDVKILSLDCFDTLLWRKTATPLDVFFAMEKSGEFQHHGLTARMRAQAEHTARKHKWMRGKPTEVTLAEIYKIASPEATEDQIAKLAAQEVAREIEYCFIFKPIFDLIVQAKNMGLKVIIVSDTYLTEIELRNLLFSAMPELEGLIDAVFCSSAFGLSKSGGIWSRLLPILKVPPEAILHLGDNYLSDVKGAGPFGIRAVHLEQQKSADSEILKGREQIGVQLLPELRRTEPFPSYFHAQIAAATELADPLQSFGYASVGPILHAFATYILNEVREISKTTTSVKVAFLLRDGFLPGEACTRLAGEAFGTSLNISRFTAIAASLTDEQSVVALLSRTLAKGSIQAVALQLLLPPRLKQKILTLALKSDSPDREFARLVLEKNNVQVIIEESLAFRRRLVAHVQMVTGVKRGDTLMFVDLGYSGTAQTLLTDVLKQDLDVDLIGRYLICAEIVATKHDRKGLMDATWLDGRVINALTGTNIAAFEMLCTNSEPSTVDYSESGTPIHSSTSIDAAQHAAVRKVQDGCLQFIDDAKATRACFKPSGNTMHMARSAAIDLARLIYYPTALEVACMRDFQFDFNLGTDKKMQLFDVDAGLKSMQRQGFAYMNAGFDALRTNYQGELRSLDLSLATLLFSQLRFGFDLEIATASYRQEKVAVLVMNEHEHLTTEIIATATYDGYFALSLPLSNRFHTGILLGKAYEWLQIDGVQVITDKKLSNGVEMHGDALTFDQIERHGNDLFKVETGGMIFVPARPEYEAGHICRLVFRPISRR